MCTLPWGSRWAWGPPDLLGSPAQEATPSVWRSGPARRAGEGARPWRGDRPPAAPKRRLEVRQVPGERAWRRARRTQHRRLGAPALAEVPGDPQGTDAELPPFRPRAARRWGNRGAYLPEVPGRRRKGAWRRASRRGWPDGHRGASAARAGQARAGQARAPGSQAAADAGGSAGVLRRSCEGAAPPWCSHALTLAAVDGCKSSCAHS